MVKIIDCTIRDGGHLNNWEFETALINDSYSAANESKIDYFEIGYLPLKSNLPMSSNNCKLTAMVNIKDFNVDNIEESSSLKTLRVATYPKDIEKAFNSVYELKAKGYEVFINLMASSTMENKDFQLLKKQDKNLIEALYFADTYGAFYPNEIKEMILKLKDTGFETLGFHSHNNLQLAFANSITAIENGIDFIDASAYGMGRGAGNLPIELLLSYLNKDSSSYVNLIKKHYLNLIEKYPWGYNIKNKITAKNNIHPSSLIK